MLGRRTDAERAAENEFQALLSQMVSGQIDLRGLPLRLSSAAEAAGMRDRKVRQLQDQAFRGLAERVLADDVLTQEEEGELFAVAEILEISDADMSARFADVFESLYVASVNDGRLPVVSNPRLIAKHDEVVHAEWDAALMKEVVHREYRGGSSGVSVPIGMGIRVRTGGVRGRSVVTGVTLEPADTGVLSVTDRRAVFLGAKKTQESRYDRLVGLEVFSDAVRLAVSNRQNASLFRVPSGPMAAAVLNVASQRHE